MPGALFLLCLVSFVLLGGIYYINPHYYSLPEKLMAALFATGECGAETIADNNNQRMEYVLPLLIFPST